MTWSHLKEINATVIKKTRQKSRYPLIKILSINRFFFIILKGRPQEYFGTEAKFFETNRYAPFFGI